MYFVKYIFNNTMHSTTLIDTDYGNRSLIYRLHLLISKP